MSLMKQRDWFILIRDWKAKGMGQVGVTLPFLVGALARKTGQANLSVQDIRSLLREIVERPEQGYVTEVRWCPNVQAPVLSVSMVNDPNRLPFKSYYSASNGQPSLGFSQDIQSMSGLSCSGAQECLEALVSDAAPHIKRRTFSRTMNQTTWQREYGPFSPQEEQFIDETIGRHGAVET